MPLSEAAKAKQREANHRWYEKHGEELLEKQRQEREQVRRVVATLEVARKDTCFVWGCNKPCTKDPVTGKKRGARGMCWQHYKQAQRAGDLVPFSQIEKIRPSCRLCGKPARYIKIRLCERHYHKLWRQNTPTREAMLERQRKRQREAVKANPEGRKAVQRRYRQSHAEQHREHNRASYARNREAILERQRQAKLMKQLAKEAA